MKKVFLAAVLLISLTTSAQVKDVTIQASGLTCSMCSNSIFKALQTLEFVDKVEPNIQTSSFYVTFKTGAQVEFDKMKAKVEDAGFFVARFTVTMNFDKLLVEPDKHVNIGNAVFHFLNTKKQELSGEKTVRIMDKGYVSAKEFKKNSSYSKMECVKESDENGVTVFHVTI